MSMVNYVVQNDLKKYYPNLANQLWSAQTDYTTQIAEAYSIVLNDIHNLNFRPERTNVELDLNVSEYAIDKNIPPTWITTTTATTGSVRYSHYERRILLDITTLSGSFNFYIDGNNDTNEPSAVRDYKWVNASTFALTSSYANSKVTQAIDNTYRLLRYRISPVVAGTITFNVVMVSNIFDAAIIHKTLELIFTDFMKESGDVWDIRRQLEADKYKSSLALAKFSYDANETGVIDPGEDKVNLGTLKFF